MKFLLESTKRTTQNSTVMLPKNDFVYSFVEVVDYHNWQAGKENDQVEFVIAESFSKDQLTQSCVPVGSVQLCLEWYRQMGVQAIRPLNIPEELDSLSKHSIIRTDNLPYSGRRYFGKVIDHIKSEKNGWYTEYHGDEKMFFAEEVAGVCSEWRIFVCDGIIQGMKCYSGYPFIAPDMVYCNRVIKAVEKSKVARAYTLDLIVQGNGSTDILELHDFFACGLYGFSDPIAIRRMAILTQGKLLGGM